MTSISFTQANTHFHNERDLSASFAARLARLQIHHEQVARHTDGAAIVARGALALVPFLALASMFIAL